MYIAGNLLTVTIHNVLHIAVTLVPVQPVAFPVTKSLLTAVTAVLCHATVQLEDVYSRHRSAVFPCTCLFPIGGKEVTLSVSQLTTQADV